MNPMRVPHEPPALRCVVIAVAAALLCACGGGLLPGSATTVRPSSPEWAIVLSMDVSADLRGHADADLRAMEAVGLSGTGITVLALVNDDTGARLYEVADDPAGLSPFESSIPIAVPALGIDPAGPDVTLDMSDPATLSELLSFVERWYAPAQCALVLWGEGTGYRGAALLAAALRGHTLEVIGFDTSFSAGLEVAWELRNTAKLMVASQGIVPETGWDYGQALRQFIDSDRTAGSLSDAMATGAAGAAGRTALGARRFTVSVIDLTRLEPVMSALNSFSNAVYDEITGAASRDAVRATFFYDVEDFYATPGDLSIDVGDLGVVVRRDHGIADDEATALINAVRAAVRSNLRGSERQAASGMSVHLIPLRADGTATAGHAPEYLQGSPVPTPLSFVIDSTWVPVYPAGPGLLYRLFYEPL